MRERLPDAGSQASRRGARRRLLGQAIALAVAPWLAGRSAATAARTGFDAGPVRLVLPLAPGGAMDVLGRGLAEALGTRLGTTFVVDNRAGAGGNIATEFVARERPDGRTLLLTSNAFVANVTLYAGQVRYDPLRDFAPIGMVATTPAVIVVRANAPSADLAALRARALDRGISVATPGHGNGNHLALVRLQAAAGGDWQHIPYKGAGPAVAGLLGGETDAAIVALPAVTAQLRSGALRALAVLQADRSAVAPRVPTVSEAGLAVALDTGWFGLLAPAGTPPEILDRLQRAVAATLADPAYRRRLEDQGFDPSGSGPTAFATQLASDVARFPGVLRRIGARVD
jgi:tripartite-type tricarboxylate transporter receptor subunit TctC